MDGADQRRPHRLRGLSAVLTVFVAPPATIAAADDRHIARPNPGAGATLSISGRLCYQAGLRLSARGAIPGTDRAHDSTAHKFQL